MHYQAPLADLTDAQRRVVEWQDGPLLVLASPDSRTTHVLARRVARLLDAFRDRRFRILALTVTRKAAHEMTSRVTTSTPGLEERVTLDTFHGFCAQVLRQHGAHLDIRPDFAVYPEIADRQAVLDDALRRGGARNASDVPRLLLWIDRLKEQLVDPDRAEACRAAIYSALAGAPTSTEERDEQDAFLKSLCRWGASRAVVEQARRRIGADRTAAPRVLDCFAGGEAVMRP